jgi:nucleoside-diphosphate-sugar epimerase
VRAVRKRQTPVIGDGQGVMSFVHLHDAAAAAVLALHHDGPAIYNIVDDEPAPMSDWIAVLAEVLDAKPPRRVPPWIARLIAGPGLTMLTESRGASNARAKGELGWYPRYPSWREGFASAYGEHPDAAIWS